MFLCRQMNGRRWGKIEHGEMVDVGGGGGGIRKRGKGGRDGEGETERENGRETGLIQKLHFPRIVV